MDVDLCVWLFNLEKFIANVILLDSLEFSFAEILKFILFLQMQFVSSGVGVQVHGLLYCNNNIAKLKFYDDTNTLILH